VIVAADGARCAPHSLRRTGRRCVALPGSLFAYGRARCSLKNLTMRRRAGLVAVVAPVIGGLPGMLIGFTAALMLLDRLLARLLGRVGLGTAAAESAPAVGVRAPRQFLTT
jgi:hypothetical protein